MNGRYAGRFAVIGALCLALAGCVGPGELAVTEFHAARAVCRAGDS